MPISSESDVLGISDGSDINDMDNTSTVVKQLAGKSWLHFRNRRTIASVVLSIRGEIMKKQILGAVVTGCLLALMIAVPAHAQLPGTIMRVAIPFDFIVKGKTFPAGNYEIRRISDSPEGLIIQNANEKRDHVIFETEPVETSEIPNTSEIVFHRYGDSYFLAEVLTSCEATGQQLAPNRDERLHRSEMDSNRSHAET